LFASIQGPTLATLVTTLSFGGLTELGVSLKRLLVWRAPWYIYVIIILLPFVFTGSAIGLFAFLSGSPVKFDRNGLAMIPIVILAAYFYFRIGFPGIFTLSFLYLHVVVQPLRW
jgi:hypothetical protein